MKRLILVSILGSMAFTAIPVKAQAEDLPSANKGSKSTFKDSIKDVKNSWSQFVDTVMNSGQDHDFVNGFAQAVGLPAAMPTKFCHISISGHGNIGDDRAAHVVYEQEGASEGPDSGKHPTCVYLWKGHSSKHDVRIQYFRVSLDGQLEKAITLKNKRDDNGKDIRESRARSEEDIEDPEIQRIFKAEMSYWLKDWLKKHRKATTKTTKLPAVDSASAPTAP